MKIAVISSGHIPSQWAHSIAVAKNANGFSKLSHDVTLFTVRRFEESRTEQDIESIREYYDLNQSILVEVVTDRTPMYFKERRYLSYISSIYRLAVPNKIRKRFDPLHTIIDRCIEREYDVCYCRTWNGAYYAIQQDIPTIVEAHSPNTDKPKAQRVINLAEKDAFRGFITIAEDLREAYISAGIPQRKTIVLEDGVDIERFDTSPDRRTSRKQTGLPLDKNLIMYTGSLYPEKGIGHILQMASRLDEATFVLVGGPDDQVDRWRDKARKKGVENIRFEGFVPVSEIPAYLSAANILVMPYDTSQTDGVMDLNTTSPLKLFEYMAAQRPIISTDIPAISRTIEHETNGLLAPPNDIETLVSYVRRVLEDEGFAKRLSRNARIDAEKYSWEKRCERMITAFV